MNRITKNNDFITYYLAGGREQKNCNNLHIKGDKLFNYDTVIAQKSEDGTLYINMTKYSTSTSRIQNALLREAQYYYYTGLIVLNNIQIDTKDLLN